MSVDPAILLQGIHANAKMDQGLQFLPETVQRRFSIECAEETLYVYQAPGGGDTLIKGLDAAKELLDHPATPEVGQLHMLCSQIARSQPNPSKDAAQAVASCLAFDASMLLACKYAQGAHLAFNVQVDETIKDREKRRRDTRKRTQEESDLFCGKQLARLADHIRQVYREAEIAAQENNYPAIRTRSDLEMIGATLLRDQVRRLVEQALLLEPEAKVVTTLSLIQTELSEKNDPLFWNLDKIRATKSLLERAKTNQKSPLKQPPAPAKAATPQLEAK